MGLVDGEDFVGRLVNFEPGIGDGDAFERFVFGAREGAAPVGGDGLL